MSKVKKQHPIAWWDGEYGIAQYEYEAGEDWVPLYEHPKINHKWVGLTDDELRQIWYDDAPVEGGTYVDKLRQVEAKLKEKNA